MLLFLKIINIPQKRKWYKNYDKIILTIVNGVFCDEYLEIK